MSSSDPTATGSPDLRRRGAIATGLAVVVNVVLLFATTATGAVQPFMVLTYPPVVFLSAVGAIGAAAVYAVIRRRRERPDRDFAVLAAVVLVLSWIPDLTFVPTIPGSSTGGIVILMAMHVTTAAISYAVLTRGP